MKTYEVREKMYRGRLVYEVYAAFEDNTQILHIANYKTEEAANRVAAALNLDNSSEVE
jgi:hypothetical protein